MDKATEKRLIDAAAAVRQHAHAPYSNYKVGAALLDKQGTIHTGCNVENAAYGSGLCAERGAVLKAVSEGRRDFVAVAVVTQNGGAPCGACRQVLREFSPNLIVLVADANGKTTRFTLENLLPESFGPEMLR